MALPGPSEEVLAVHSPGAGFWKGSDTNPLYCVENQGNRKKCGDSKGHLEGSGWQLFPLLYGSISVPFTTDVVDYEPW